MDILFLWLEINTFQAKCLQLPSKNEIYCLLHFPFLLLCSWVRYALNLFTYSVCNAFFNFKILCKNKFWSSIRINLIISDWLLIIRKTRSYTRFNAIGIQEIKIVIIQLHGGLCPFLRIIRCIIGHKNQWISCLQRRK